MRADYDSQGDTLQLSLEPVDQLDRADSSVHPRAVVHLLDARPVLIDVLGASGDVAEPLAAVATRYDLDVEVLKAAARGALEVPDREIVLDVLDRSAG